jgi:hypothetical protein
MLDKILIQKNWISAILAGKVLLLLALLWLIYDRIWVQQVETGYMDHFLAALSGGKLGWLALCVVLAPINWTLEVVKWKKLIAPFQQISWQKASQSILAGIALGVLTPGRLGEYGGRLLHSSEGHRSSTLYANFVGSLSQNIPVFVFGALGVSWYFTRFYFANAFVANALACILLLMSVFMTLLYVQHQALAQWLVGFKWFHEFARVQGEVAYGANTLHQVILLSLLRYLIFATQYLSLLFLFGMPLNVLEGWMGIFVIFVFQTGLPLPPLLGVVARTQLSVIVWSVFSTDQLTMLVVPMILYTINLVVPSLAGGLVLISTNIQKQISND